MEIEKTASQSLQLFFCRARGLKLSPPPQDDSLPHNGPAADSPAFLPPLPPPQHKQQQQLQPVSLHPWQPLLRCAAAASQRPTSRLTPYRCRTMMTTATVAGARAAKTSACEEKQLRTGSGVLNGRSSSSAPTCPLHACLLWYGITDLAAFSAPRHLALSQEAVSRNVEPKLEALAAEGLTPQQVASILAARDSPLPCSYAETFQPNLRLLQEIAAHIIYRPHPKAPQLTAVGKVLAASPRYVAQYLSRNPSKVQQLLQSLGNDLGIGSKQLASCSTLTSLLYIPASTAQGAIALLLEKGLPVEEVARMTLTHSHLFKYSNTALAAKLAALEGILDLDAAAALHLAVGQPSLLTVDIRARLPPLLHFLDTYMGEVGAGRRLVLAQPVVGAVSATTAERSMDSLAARGYSQQQIQGMIGKQPTLLNLNLDSPLQRQKMHWIERVSPWALDDFLAKPRYFSGKTRRLAARLALLGECGLQPPTTPASLANYSDAGFIAAVRTRLAREGRELPWASWAAWEEAWLGKEEGREWGFPPLRE
ncbi:hypothetical protein N2152v2_009973 [Parachlorella kessleri]